MRHLLTILAIYTFQISYSQELDIFQNDSLYSMNKISSRTMYSLKDTSLQKELVTTYNPTGQKSKQFWYWNGDSNFHNVQTFYYSSTGLISSLIDSFANGTVEITNYFYDNNLLKHQVTLDQNNDTCDFRFYPSKNMTIKRWYMDGKPYRYDTTIFERKNIKFEYYGMERYSGSNDLSRWHYKYINQFDTSGNLVKISFGGRANNSTTKYTYDNRNLLKYKDDVLMKQGKIAMRMQYTFIYE